MNKIKLNDPLVLVSLKLAGIGVELSVSQMYQAPGNSTLLSLDIELIVWEWGWSWEI